MASEPVKPQPTTPDTEEEASSSKFAFVMGWIVLPGSVILGLVGLGAHWGARYPDAWFVDAVKWIAERVL